MENIHHHVDTPAVKTRLSVQEVKTELLERWNRQDEIRARIDEFMEREYGVSNFSQLADQEMGAKPNEVLVSMARQLPTASIEGVGLHLLVEWLRAHGVPAAENAISYARNGFGNHDYKQSLVYPTLSWGRNEAGTIDLQNKRRKSKRQKRKRKAVIKKAPGENILNRVLATLEMDPKREMLTDAELFADESEMCRFLLDFHQRLREIAFGATNVHHDVEAFFKYLLDASVISDAPRKPDQGVTIVKRDGKEYEQRASIAEAGLEAMWRPTADWYYFAYLLSFVDGNRVMVASMDDDESVQEWFRKCDAIEEMCGFRPLIIEVPYKEDVHGHTSLFNEIAMAVLRDPEWKQRVHNNDEHTTFNPFGRHPAFESMPVHDIASNIYTRLLCLTDDRGPQQ